MSKTVIIVFKRCVFPKGGSTTESNTKVLLSRYIVKDILKSGQDTNVYLVKHPTLEQKLIIKQLCISVLSTARFNREVQILKTLKNPHIPLLYDIQKDNDYYYIIEEYIEGQSLKSIIDKNCLSVNTAIRYIIQLCDILQYLHEHPGNTILYLDCRPDNIIISAADDAVNLIDFGNSILQKDTTRRTFCYGSIGYAAPELYNPHTGLSPKTDIYGVGALLYYMLTGSLSLSDPNLHKRKIPTKLLYIIRKCLRHQPGMRYQNIDDLKKALTKIYNHKKLSNNSENTSLTISIAGCDRRVGVTHLGMSLVRFLTKRGYHSSLLQTYNDTIDFSEADIPNNNKPTIIINDFGILNKTNSDGFNSADICLLVGCGKAWEFNTLLKAQQFCNLQKTIFIVNLVNGSDFYRQIKRHNQTFIRMPYYCDWRIPGKIGNRFLEELTDEIKKRWKE